jgi:NAD-dependent deacetylase
MNSSSLLPEPLVERLESVRSVGAITGAGVSQESGIPTYRGQGGLYDDPEEGDRTIESLSGHTLRSDPDRTWRAVSGLARNAGTAEPNDAHLALARIELKVERFVLLTQNVDGLHQLAGSRNVIDIHGDVYATRCMACGDAGRLDCGSLSDLKSSPRCERCGGILRPDAVLFGELLPMEKVERILKEFIGNPPELILVAGTSALFPYITELVTAAVRANRLTIEVNPERTALTSEVDYALAGPAGRYLPAIEAALRSTPPALSRPEP